MERIMLRAAVRHLVVSAAVVCGLVSVPAAAERHHPKWHDRTAITAPGPSLTIGGRRPGIYRVGNTIVAPGGFAAHGYGYPVATPEEREDARNAAVRDGSTALYGFGADGLGGFGHDGPGTGSDNPNYGNAFSGYTGYNGTPAHLAFGPGYANRYNTDREGDEDERESPPSPAALGYRDASPDADDP